MSNLRGNPWAVLVTLSLGFFMTLLDLTIVNIAIPSMIDALNASLDEVLWVVNSYVLVLAVLLITAGRLGDLRGQRNLFALGVALFTLASLACGLSPNPTVLIIFRAIQGLGAALLMPQTMAIIIATFPANRRGTALGIWGAVAGLATVAGPTLGGLLVTIADWRWIFFVNLPVGIVVFVFTFVVIPDTRLERQHKLDVLGVAIATVSLFCLTFGLIEGQRFSWNTGIWALMAASVGLFAIFMVQQRGRQSVEPLVPFVLFRDRNFAVLNVVGCLVSVGIIGFFLPLTIYLQSVLGFSALKAGLILAPMSLVGMVLAPVAGKMSDRVGGKYILMAGLTLFGLGAALLVALAEVGTSWPTFLPAILLLGVGFGGIFAPMATEAMRSVPPQLAGAASGVNNTVRQVGSVIGSAAVGALLQHQLAISLASEAAGRAGALPANLRSQFISGFSDTGGAGLEVTATQSRSSLPSGLPTQVAQQLRQSATAVFEHGYVRAMHPTMVLPVAAMLVAALSCLLVRRMPVRSEPDIDPAAVDPGANDRAVVDPAANGVVPGATAIDVTRPTTA
jgi:EmrB/QacA subfamily drug resistance transporter